MPDIITATGSTKMTSAKNTYRTVVIIAHFIIFKASVCTILLFAQRVHNNHAGYDLTKLPHRFILDINTKLVTTCIKGILPVLLTTSWPHA